MTNRDEEVSRNRQELERHPQGDIGRAEALFDLAFSLSKRYEEKDQTADLEEAISLHGSALDLRPAGHSDRYISLGELACCLNQRYFKQDTIPDLQEAIRLSRDALKLICDPSRDVTLINHGTYLWNRYLKLGADADLDEAISFCRSALDLRPAGHTRHSYTLNSLVNDLTCRFEKQGAAADLDELISLYRSILDLQPLGHPDHATSIDKLLLHIQKRLQQLPSTAVPLGKTPSAPHEPENTDQHTSLLHSPMSVHDIVICVKDLVDKGDEEIDVDEIVNLARASLKLCPPDHADHITSLTTLASSLRRRFQQRDAIADMDEVIDLYRRVLDACPSGTPACAPPLHALAFWLSDRFTKLARMTDLDDAIKFEQAALEHRPPGHPDHTESLDSLTYYRQLRIQGRGAIPQPARGPTTSSRAQHLIGDIVFDVVKDFPPRLLNTHTGMLCDRDSQMTYFEKSQEYHKLLSSASALDTIPPTSHVRNIVSTYFRYVTLSHRWGRFEPLLRDIEGQVVYDLAPTDGLLKLQSFCLTSCRHGYLWAWTDTCCIDKESSAELQEAIGSMFSWYRQSALTMVHLADVSNAGALGSSVWFKRGWTLQELLAPDNMLFFRQDWSLYKDGISNHKENDIIISELEQATGVASRYFTHFCPGLDDARSRLQWASTRRTTRGEDIAYSLLGIFNLHMPVLYGESAENAIGRLLAEVISKSGDTSILDWVGQSSTFHSCLPTTLTPYQTLPPPQPLLADPKPWSYAQYIWNFFIPTSSHPARRMHQALSDLPRTQFTNFRLVLPCIVHRIQAITLTRVDTIAGTHIHRIQAVGLEPIELALSERLTKTSRGVPYVLIRPWHSNLLDPTVETDDTSARRWLGRLERPFRVLLLMALPHNEYQRVASYCNIMARPTSAGILKGEVSTLTII